MIVTPPCYPARPVNGGPLPKAPPKSGEWFYEPKFNGWRTLVHVPTSAMFNRHGKRLSIEKEFARALETLKSIHGGRPQGHFDWLDCEALERRHNIGRGTLIVLDFPNVESPGGRPQGLHDSRLAYVQRNEILQTYFDPMNEFGFNPCGDDEVRCVKRWREINLSHVYSLWNTLQDENKRLGCQFYEGVVAKRADSIYPIQRRSPDYEFPFWVKHRWAF